MPLRVAVLTVLLTLAAAAPAAAVTTVSYNPTTGLLVESGGGEQNVVRITQAEGAARPAFRVSDTRAGVAAGPGCTVIATAPGAVAEGDTASCDFAANGQVELVATVRLGSGNDQLDLDHESPTQRGIFPWPARVFAGPGNDVVTSSLQRGVPTQEINGEDGDDQISGNIGADILDGGAGNDALSGGAGGDTVRGGEGDDTLDAADPDTRFQPAAVTQPFADTYEGGAGRDRVDYSARAWYESVTVNLNTATGGGGQTGENDTVKEIEDVTGGRGNDTLLGNDSDNGLRGGPGNDTIDGAKGNDDLGADALTGSASGGEPGIDQIKGGEGNDTVRGGDAADKLSGGAGDDTIEGGDGDDDTVGEDGADTIVGGLGGDIIDGGRDNDTIDALDAVADKISCGSGKSVKPGGPDLDSVRFDLKDQNPVDCETLTDGAINEGPYVGMRTARAVALDSSGALTVTLVCPRKLKIGCVGTLRAGLEPRAGRIVKALGPSVRYRLGAGKRAVVAVKLRPADRKRVARARTQLVSVEKGSFGDKRRVRTLRVRAAGR